MTVHLCLSVMANSPSQLNRDRNWGKSWICKVRRVRASGCDLVGHTPWHYFMGRFRYIGTTWLSISDQKRTRARLRIRRQELVTGDLDLPLYRQDHRQRLRCLSVDQLRWIRYQ